MKYIKGVATILTSLVLFTSVVIAEPIKINGFEHVGEQTTYTLEEAVELAMKNNPEVKAYNLILQKTNEEYEKHDRALDKLERAMKNEMNLPMDKRIEFRAMFQGETLSITIPRMNNEFLIENTKRNVQAIEAKVRKDIEESYYSLQQAIQFMDISQTNLNIAEDVHNKTKQKFELGLVAKQDVIQSELGMIQAKNTFEDSKNNVIRAEMNFNIQLGNLVMSNIGLSGELSYEKYELGNIEDAIKKGLQSRNELYAARFGYSIEKLKFDDAEKQYEEKLAPYIIQKSATEKSKTDLEKSKKMIEMEIRSNYLEVMQKDKEIVAGKKQVELAEEALKLTKLSYDVGMTVLSDLQKSQNSLLQAKLGLSKSIFDYKKAVIKYENSISLGTNAIN